MLRRQLFVGGVALGAMLAVSPLGADAPPPSRVRPQSTRVAGWVARGIAQSPTFRGLVARIDAGDILVYVDASPQVRPNMAARLTWMTDTPTIRFVRVSLRFDLGGRDAVAMIAHELQHVVELIEHPEVRSEAAFGRLFARIGHATTYEPEHWDTRAALEAGDRVRVELVGA